MTQTLYTLARGVRLTRFGKSKRCRRGWCGGRMSNVHVNDGQETVRVVNVICWRILL
jgi:hypothetical protein